MSVNRRLPEPAKCANDGLTAYGEHSISEVIDPRNNSRLAPNAQRAGPPASRNPGLRNSRADQICRADSR